MKRVLNLLPLRILAVIALVSLTAGVKAQEIKFVAHADPLITWMSSNGSDYNGEGARAGFSMGLNVLYYFAENYAASSGISFLAAGGRQSAVDDHTMAFNNFTEEVAAGDEMAYNLRYLNIPLGARLQTTRYGDLTYFTDLGFDIRALLKATVDLPADFIEDENARNEVYGMNLGWHVSFGVEYELSMESALVAGIGFDRDFFDLTKDLEDVFQPIDKSRLNMIRFKFGFKF